MRGAGATPLRALRATTADPVLRRVHASWAAVVTASWVAHVGIAVAAHAAGGSRAVAVAVVARTAPGVVVGAAAGRLTDRVPRPVLLRGAAAVAAGSCVAAALLASSLLLLVLLLSLAAAATTAYRAALAAAVPDLVDDAADLTAANAVSSAVEAVGVLVGPALAAGLIAGGGPPAAFVAAAVLAAVAATALPRTRRAGAMAARPTAAGSGGLLRLRTTRTVFGMLFAQTVVSGGLLVLTAPLAVDVLRAHEGTVGVLTAAFGAGGVLASVLVLGLAGSSRIGAVTTVALLGWALPLLPIVAAVDVATVVVLLVLAGSANVVFDVTSVTLLQRGVPSHLHGRVFGLVEAVVVVGLATGAVAAAALVRPLGADGALAALAAGLAVVALATAPAMRRLDRELAAPARQVALLRRQPSFALLRPVELERVALLLRRRPAPAGTDVVTQGAPGSTWYVVDDGRLRVTVDGRAVTELEEGGAFGEVALLRGGVRTATVTALDDAALWELDRDDFLAALGGPGGAATQAAEAVAAAHLRRAAPASEAPPRA